jgi:hypothetical protein
MFDQYGVFDINMAKNFKIEALDYRYTSEEIPNVVLVDGGAVDGVYAKSMHNISIIS